jgi:tRNA pseudouridine13 synthase
LRERCRTFDVHPSGTLWSGASEAFASVGELESAVAARFPALATGLAGVGLEPERRALRMKVAELDWQVQATNVRLRFRLGKGCFATAVLHELISNAFEADVPDSD